MYHEQKANFFQVGYSLPYPDDEKQENGSSDDNIINVEERQMVQLCFNKKVSNPGHRRILYIYIFKPYGDIVRWILLVAICRQGDAGFPLLLSI